ncbi:MAG: hypothetical protein JHC33_14440 [Ignisphaera sp.]|jgi:hypothetical protein|nr:hypothetical protein [Ignisphaera sp.]
MAKIKTQAPKNKLGSLLTPIGSALFVSCPNASAFDETKQEASIVLTPEDYESFKAQLDALIDNCTEELVVAKDKMAMPIKPETDKEGNPTGNYILRAKTSMIYKAKLYNADRSEFKPDAGFQVANRSKIRLSISVEVMATSMYKGLVFRLNAIQIISASPWANANPFDAVEGGDFVYHTDAEDTTDDQSEDIEW